MDLDAGRRVVKEQLRPEDTEDHAWVRERKLDVLGVVGEGAVGLVCFDVAMVPYTRAKFPGFSGEGWEDIPAQRLLDSSFVSVAEPKQVMQVAVTDEGPPPYLFRTREGGMGVLQFVGIADDPPGVRIRYKMVRQTGPGQPSPPHAAEAARERGRIAWGRGVGGLQSGLSFEMQDRAYRAGELVGFTLHVRNVGDKAVTLVDFVPGDPAADRAFLISWKPTVLDIGGKRLPVALAPRSIQLQERRRTLDPGVTAAVGIVFLRIDASPEDRSLGSEPHVHLSPGTYLVGQTYRFGRRVESAWSGELTTGELTLTVVPQEPDTHARPKPEQPTSGEAVKARR